MSNLLNWRTAVLKILKRTPKIAANMTRAIKNHGKTTAMDRIANKMIMAFQKKKIDRKIRYVLKKLREKMTSVE